MRANTYGFAAILRDLHMAVDPVVWAIEAGFEPDPWQADVLRSEASRIALNCARQSGKSTVAAAVALHGVLYEPNSLSIMLSPTLRQSSELFRKALGFYAATGRAVEAESETKLALELENGSRLISLPGSEASVRGYSKVRRLIVDEASRVPDE
jgi:hypothetical protein